MGMVPITEDTPSATPDIPSTLPMRAVFWEASLQCNEDMIKFITAFKARDIY